MNENLVAVVVPLSKATRFTESEKVSLRHIGTFLGRYPRFFMAPPGNTLAHDGFGEKRFPGTYFGSVGAHNRLMLSEKLYSAFSSYEYILIHHLDSLVFSDQLEEWCGRGFDLIAPPWIPGPDVPWLKEPGVGNGGLSLRRVESFLKVLRSRGRWREPKDERRAVGLVGQSVAAARQRLKGLALSSQYFNGVKSEIRSHVKAGKNEDRFWWKSGKKYYPDFRIAPVETALRFGFEANPRECFERNQGILPFGCHAWERFDRAFWEPFLLPADYESEGEN